MGRIHINTVVDKYLLDILRPGLPLVLFDDESLEVDAVAEFDTNINVGMGCPIGLTAWILPQLTKRNERIRDLWSI